MKDISNGKITLYHVSTVMVEHPEWDYVRKLTQDDSKISSDFGVGFYMSTDTEQPIKLICSKGKVVLNRYELDLRQLNVKKFGLDDDWLLTVAFHRRDFKGKKNLHHIRDQYRKLVSEHDVVIGPIADDRMFTAIQSFISSNITNVVAMESMNVMGYEDQYVLKSKKACENIRFTGSVELNEVQIEKYKDIVEVERLNVEQKLEDIRLKHFRSGKLFAEMLKEIEEGGMLVW